MCAEDSDMSAFFMNAETVLFTMRFACMTFEELCKLFKSLDSHLQSERVPDEKGSPRPYCAIPDDAFETFMAIKLKFRRWKNLVRKYVHGGQECFALPFHKVLPLVAERKVVLRNGIALVPCSRLRDIMVDLFRQCLKAGMHRARLHVKCEDERIVELSTLIKVRVVNLSKTIIVTRF